MAHNYVLQARRTRTNLIEAQKNSSLDTRMALLDTAKEKRDLIKQANPFFYMFGNKLTPTY